MTQQLPKPKRVPTDAEIARKDAKREVSKALSAHPETLESIAGNRLQRVALDAEGTPMGVEPREVQDASARALAAVGVARAVLVHVRDDDARARELVQEVERQCSRSRSTR